MFHRLFEGGENVSQELTKLEGSFLLFEDFAVSLISALVEVILFQSRFQRICYDPSRTYGTPSKLLDLGLQA
jgi:hypothetical protein